MQMMTEVATLGGDFPTAVKHARVLAAAVPTPESRFLLGTALIRSSKTARTSEELRWVEEGAEILLKLLKEPFVGRSAVASTLAANVQLSGAAAQQVLASLDPTGTNRMDLMTRVIIEVQEHPEKAGESFDRLAQTLNNAPLLERLAAADWLSGLGGTDAALKLVLTQDVKTNIYARMLRLDMATQRHEWGFIKQNLLENPDDLKPTVKTCMEAAVAMSEGDTAKADALFRNEIQNAVTKVTVESELQYIAKIAERTGNLNSAVAAHEYRLRRGAAIGDASQNILRLTRASKMPLLRQLPALEARHELMPEDENTSSQFYFVSAQLGRNLEETKRGLTALLGARPNSPELLVGIAMVLVRSGPAGITEAGTLLDEHAIDFDSVGVRIKPSLVYVLGQTGRKDLARAAARKLNLDECFPEERDMIEPWLAR